MPFKQFSLGPAANSYFIELIGQGNSLSQELLRRPLDRMPVTTWAPDDVDESSLNELEMSWRYPGEARGFGLAPYLRDRFSGDDWHVMVEDWNASASDSYFATHQEPCFWVGEEVYYFGAVRDPPALENVLRELPGRAVALVSRVPGWHIDPMTAASHGDLEPISQNAAIAIIDAYDGYGHLIMELGASREEVRR